MRVVYISKSKYYDQTIINNLKELCEQDSIAFFYSYAEAQDFINNHIVKNQIPIGLVISENNIAHKPATEFYQSITKDQARTYSNCDFRFCSVPMILIVDKDENRNVFLKHGFYDVIDNIGRDRLHLFVPQIRDAVKSWRSKVLDELGNLGIRFNSGVIDYTYLLSEDRKRNTSTTIFIREF